MWFKSIKTKNLKQYIQSVHDGVCYSCTQCDYKSKSKTTLKEHVNSVHVVISVYYNCDQCDYKAKIRRDPKLHAESVHDGIYYSCTQCVY